MRNPYEEVKELLYLHGLEEKDILWIGTREYRFYPPDLKTVLDFDYDELDESNNDLINLMCETYIVGARWYITMEEDFSDFEKRWYHAWQYHDRPPLPGLIRQAEKLTTFIERKD